MSETKQRILIWTGPEIEDRTVIERAVGAGDGADASLPYEVVIQEGEAPAAAKSMGGIAFLLRYVDTQSLERVRAAYQELSRDKRVPAAFMLFREREENDFKMSCPHCGQKLWIRDSDVDKRGRCPNCKRAFNIPAQPQLLRDHLEVPDSVEVTHIRAGDHESGPQVLSKLIHAKADLAALMDPLREQTAAGNATVIIEIPEEFE